MFNQTNFGEFDFNSIRGDSNSCPEAIAQAPASSCSGVSPNLELIHDDDDLL